MATHFTRTTGPHVTSSVQTSRSTTVTHSSGGTTGTKFSHNTVGGLPMTTGHTQQFITGPAPFVTTSTTRYSGTTPTLLGQGALTAQGSLLTGGTLLGGSILGGLMPTPGMMPTTGLLPSNGLVQHQPMYYSRVSAPMAVCAPMGIASPNERPPSAAASSRMQSSMTINNVHCEGALGLTDTAIVEALNLFVGVAPFVLDHASLEVTPEFTVVTRNPDIKFHLPALPDGAPMSLSQLRTLAGLDANATVHVALPGQQSCVLSQEADGVLKVINGPQGATTSGNVLGTLRV